MDKEEKIERCKKAWVESTIACTDYCRVYSRSQVRCLDCPWHNLSEE